MSNVLNADRATLARVNAFRFARMTNQVESGDWEHDRAAVYADLMTNIMHAAREEGYVVTDLIGRAQMNYDAEIREKRHENGRSTPEGS